MLCDLSKATQLIIGRAGMWSPDRYSAPKDNILLNSGSGTCGKGHIQWFCWVYDSSVYEKPDITTRHCHIGMTRDKFRLFSFRSSSLSQLKYIMLKYFNESPVSVTLDHLNTLIRKIHLCSRQIKRPPGLPLTWLGFFLKKAIIETTFSTRTK